jgi:hypothetical protein
MNKKKEIKNKKKKKRKIEKRTNVNKGTEWHTFVLATRQGDAESARQGFGA